MSSRVTPIHDSHSRKMPLDCPKHAWPEGGGEEGEGGGRGRGTGAKKAGIVGGLLTRYSCSRPCSPVNDFASSVADDTFSSGCGHEWGDAGRLPCKVQGEECEALANERFYRKGADLQHDADVALHPSPQRDILSTLDCLP